MSTFASRLQEAMNALDIRPADLAKLTGIDKSTISRYLSGKYVPKQKRTDLLAQALHVDPGYLIAGTSDGTDASPAAPQEAPATASFSYTLIPVGISAGQLEDCEALTRLPKISVPDVIMGPYARDPNVVFMRVNGESMNRVIENGATIAVMTGLDRCQICNGDIVIARHDGAGYTIKRYYDLPEKRQIILTPDSNDPGYLPIPISYESPDALRLFGKVVMYSVIL